MLGILMRRSGIKSLTFGRREIENIVIEKYKHLNVLSFPILVNDLWLLDIYKPYII